MTYDEALTYFTRRYGTGRLGQWFAKRDARAQVAALEAVTV